MHVLFSVNATWNILNFRRPLIEALLADGHRVTVLAPLDDSANVLEKMGCRVVDLKLDRKGLNPLADIALTARFLQKFYNLKPDCILSFTIKNNIYGAFAARIAQIPFIPNVTGLGTAFLSSKILEKVTKALYRSAFRSSPTVFFQNEDDLQLFLDSDLVSRQQAELLPGSGIDLARFACMPYPSATTPVRFLMIARLLRDKGVLEYVAAARALLSNPRYSFQLLGAIDPLNRSAISKEVVQEWVEAGIVEYLGTTNDVRPYIERSHCVVLPSYREGAPRTLIEAAALGRPLVAADVPGCRSVVDHESNGFLCAARSSSSLKEAILLFGELAHSKKAVMASSSRTKAEKQFDAAIVAKAYRAAIAKVAG